jgi:hypothetical protein
LASADDDRAAAGSAQTIDERRDHAGDHAPASGGRKREEVLDHAHPVGRRGAAAVGDRNAALNREMEMIGVALRTIDFDHSRAEFGREVEAVDLAALRVVGHDQSKQGVPIAVGRHRPQFHRRAAVGDVALERHPDGDEALLEIVKREAGEKRVGRQAIPMDHAPGRVAEMLVHRRENRFDFGFGLRGEVVDVVRLPHVWAPRVGYDAAMRRREDAGAKP